jgi:ATP-dependent DNA helicase RecG
VITLDSPVTTVLGDKSKIRKRMAEGLGIETVGDLLRHFPRRYVKTGELTKVAELSEGEMLTVVGEIVHSKQHQYQDRRTRRLAYRLETILQTDGPSLKMTFFAKNPGTAGWHARRLSHGRRGVFGGQVSRFRGEWQLTNPRMLLFGVPGEGAEGDDEGSAGVVDNFGDLYPIYPQTKGVESWDIQRAVNFARSVIDDVPELVPDDIRKTYDVVDARRAVDLIHAPDSFADVETGRRRYRFEEALVTQVVLARRRAFVRALGAQARTGGGGLLAAFDERLPFTLTEGQRRIGEVVEADLASPHPMNRLLQGEVGSGKTLVALRAMLRVVDSGGQAALLAPTEVLAQQHYRSITALLGDLAAGGMLGGAADGTTVALLTGSMPKAPRAEAMTRMVTGEAGIVIGTHALLEEKVEFFDLGLVVVDEQHRFGVEQRAALTDKAGWPPHVLVMTATPIPRTVAMTVFGDLEVSTLSELPAGRAPIQTNVVPLAEQPTWEHRVWERVREEVDKGHQAYVVCPRITGDQIEEGETDAGEGWSLDELERLTAHEPPPQRPSDRHPLRAVLEVVEELRSVGPLSDTRVEMLHGQLPPDEKDRVMRAFAAGEVDVLVSTTVIEVGVDVANATTMVLLDADRFGISQLHQMRGRVGRGGLPGLCLLVSRAVPGSQARERLDAVAATTDGFELSRLDLDQRREGDVLGASQSGFRSSLTMLRVLRDEDTIVAAREAATAVLQRDPELSTTPDLAVAVAELEQSRQSDFIEKA